MPDPVLAAAPLLWSTADHNSGLLLSTRFLAALAAGDQISISRVDVYSGPTLLQTLPNVVDGSITVDYTATTRRTLTLTVESQGRDLDELIPVLPTDLLHPASGNELHVYRGFEYPDGTQDLCQLGVFRMSKPKITDTGDSLTIAITGNDRSAYISRIKWTAPFFIRAGTDLATAIQYLIENRWLQSYPLTYNFVSTSPVPPGYHNTGQTLSAGNTSYGTSPSSSNDPWADAIALAASGGMDLYFDVYGVCTLTPTIVTSTLGTTFDGLYEEGQTATFTEVDRSLDETQTYSGVLAIGNGSVPNVAPVQSRAPSPTDGRSYPGIWNTDRASSTYYDPGAADQSLWGPVPYIFETTAIPGYQTMPLGGSTTLGGFVLTVGSTVGVGVGPITGPGIPSGTTVQSATGGQVTMSAAATESIGNGLYTVVTGADNQDQAQAKINSAATALLSKVTSILDEPTWQCLPNPAMWENDIVGVRRERMGVHTTNSLGVLVPTAYIIQGFTIPLLPTGLMAITGRPKVQTE